MQAHGSTAVRGRQNAGPLSPRSNGRGAAARARHDQAVAQKAAEHAAASAGQVQGFLERINDFLVVLTDADGRHRSFSRRGATPGVELDDPMAVHRAMLPLYSDTDIHNVTAYLATLK